MRYGVLGPLSVSDDGQPAVVTAGRDRIVLAMLLLHPHRIVTPGELVEALWGVQPPTTARGQLQTCVSRLRRALPPDTIRTDPAGYGIRVGPGELDSAEFTRLLDAARVATDPADARRDYRLALDLWRGPALPEIDSHPVRRAAVVLDERRAVATEDWVDLEFAAGHNRDLLGELADLVDRFPLRERLRGQLMTALYRAGRQGDALAEFRHARETLVDELGVEPGPELQDLHRKILSGAVAAAPAVERDRERVRCLPRTVGDFTGRAELVGRLHEVAAKSDGANSAVVVVDGMAGSGKTTLALHLAALVGERYPDAHLFVDLHGHSEEQPLEPASVLLILLRQLGVAAEKIPEDLVDRVGLWRTEMAALKALVVFDNVASSAQIADLLPTGAGGLALVTSRRRLIGLDHVHAESLDVLAEDEAISLLARIAGPRVAAEPAAAAEVARRCGGLPLAIRLAGARLAHRPRWQVSDLVRRMGDATLPELAAENRTVANAFTLSYQQLPEHTRRVFRLLGLMPGPQFDAFAVAAITGLTLDETGDVLDDLVDMHLVQEPEPQVFRLHDLLREYAAALAADLPDEERAGAVDGLLNFELHATLATESPSRLPSTLLSMNPPAAVRPELLSELDDPAERQEQFRGNLRAQLTMAIAGGRPEFAWMLPRAAWTHLWTRGYLDEVSYLMTFAGQAAKAAGDQLAEAMSANYLASTHYRRGRWEQAMELMRRAVRLLDPKRYPVPVATLLGNMAAISVSTGDYREALRLGHQAERMSLAAAGDNGVVHMNNLRLDAMAIASSMLGHHDAALYFERRRLLGQREVCDKAGIADAMVHLFQIRLRAGTVRPDYAARWLRILARHLMTLGYRVGEADAHTQLAEALRQCGRHGESLSQLRQALVQYYNIGDTSQMTPLLCAIATVLADAGILDEAEDTFRQALQMEPVFGSPRDRAVAHLGLGDLLGGRDASAARWHWDAALRIFTELAVPERFTAAERLGRGVDQLQEG